MKKQTETKEVIDRTESKLRREFESTREHIERCFSGAATKEDLSREIEATKKHIDNKFSEKERSEKEKKVFNEIVLAMVLFFVFVSIVMFLIEFV